MSCTLPPTTRSQRCHPPAPAASRESAPAIPPAIAPASTTCAPHPCSTSARPTSCPCPAPPCSTATAVHPWCETAPDSTSEYSSRARPPPASTTRHSHTRRPYRHIRRTLMRPAKPRRQQVTAAQLHNRRCMTLRKRRRARLKDELT